jgi:hypothetical protein
MRSNQLSYTSPRPVAGLEPATTRLKVEVRLAYDTLS